MHLDPTSLNSNGTFRGQQMRLEHRSHFDHQHDGRVGRSTTKAAAVLEPSGPSSCARWPGAVCAGQFSNIPDSAGAPRLLAGTFGAEATGAGGSEGSFLGSFVGTKE